METHPETTKPLPKTDATPALRGAVVAQYKRCGKPGCRCADGGLHGPYWYRVWRERRVYVKVYVRSEDLDTVRQACREGAQQRQRIVRRRQEHAQALRQSRGAWARLRSTEGGAA